MKRLLLVFGLLIITMSCFAQKAKYVFFFIGDGMGVNQVQATEMYRGELKNKIGIDPLLFTQFPYMSVVTTFSASAGVTDSAASGTALATGNKTKNGTLGLKADLKTSVNSVAVWAQQAGRRVGVCTTVGVDNATPAAFYAHQVNRRDYYQVGLDLIKANFDYYGGSDLVQPTNKKDPKAENLYSLSEKAGYTVARGYDEYLSKAKNAKKMILLQPRDAKDIEGLPYTIDFQRGDMTLEEQTKAGLDFLMRNNKNGFFFMVEGGKIDHACHGNDGATMFQEIMAFDNAIRIAYDFYKKHPKETLIVVSADHETGGIVLGNGRYSLNLKVLASQKVSQEKFTEIIANMRKESNNQVTWTMVQQALKKYFGFWDTIKLSAEQEDVLKKTYDESFSTANSKMDENLYAKNELIAAAARKILNDMANLSWANYSHSGGYVPVYAIGAGAELFHSRMDNTDIPKKIAKAAGYIMK
jgi:alkaline phosphatase